MQNYIDKIDCHILKNVKSYEYNSKSLDCIVYVQDFNTSLEFFSKKQFNILSQYPFIKALALRVNLNDFAKLAQLSQVNYISSKAQVYAQVDISRKIMNINEFHKQGIKGKNVRIAIVDTGLSPHVDLVTPVNRIVTFVDFLNHKKNIYDDNGHGTAVAGLLAGNGIKSAGKYKGIAPESELIILKALDSEGQTTTIEMLNSMQWIYDNHEKYNIRIVCMSFGATPLAKNDPLVKGAEKLWKEGICVVAAAGNSGPNSSTVKSPAVSNKIISVGAFNDNRQENPDLLISKFTVPEFSSRGPAFDNYKPDVLATGVNVMTTSQNGDYAKMSGTSMSTPIIAGTCALLLQYSKFSWNPDEIKTILTQNCTTLHYERNTEGFGAVIF